MRIAYFTTAQDKQEYLNSPIESNPSNQVFHSNFIECLSLTNDVNVFVLRSNAYGNKESFVNKKGNVTWNYLQTKSGKFANLTSQISYSKKIKDKFDVAFVDTMNTRCLLAARGFSKKNNVPLIGLVTDNPYNITNASSFSCKMLLRTSKKCDGFVCLTDALNTLFNKKNKPYILIKGLSKNPKVSKSSPVDYPYFFYAGTLLKKYGICNLVEAFKNIKDEKIKLVIAGHHNNNDFVEAIKGDERIVFLGNVDNDIVSDYENHSIANINSRPFMEQIDKYSIPSKVIEYSSKNSLIISGYSSELKNVFNDSILWIDESNSLSQRMQEALSSKKEMINAAKAISEKEFSLEVNNKKLQDFLSNILK